MNVLHLTLSFRPGGRRFAITTLAKQLQHENVRSDLGCLDELGCSTQEAHEGIDAVGVFGRKSIFDLSALRRLDRFCFKRRIDIIHCHDAASQYLAALLRLRKPRYRLLMTFHRSLDFESARLRDRFRNAFANWLSGAIVTGSKERQNHFLRSNFVRSRKVIRIPFGIDTRRFESDAGARESIRSDLGINSNTIVLGAVGHFGREKGIDVVVRGYQELSQRPLPAPVVLVVIGTGSVNQQQALRALAQETPSARVVFAGFHSNVERWLSAFDLFVHAPRLEAFGLALVEAMAARLPTVATCVGGVPDIVRDGRTGLLVSPDAPEELADAMQRLICESDSRAAMADEALRVARTEYGTELYAQRYLAVYRDLLAGRPLRGVDQEDKESDSESDSSQRPVVESMKRAAGRRVIGSENVMV